MKKKQFKENEYLWIGLFKSFNLFFLDWNEGKVKNKCQFFFFNYTHLKRERERENII